MSDIFKEDGHLTKEALQNLKNENLEELTRLEIAEHLSYCDECLMMYTELLEDDMLMDVKNSVVSNGCLIEGTIENSIIGRGCVIKKGAVIKNSVILPAATISEDVHIENHVVDKHAKVIHAKDLTADPEKPGYIRRGDTL